MRRFLLILCCVAATLALTATLTLTAIPALTATPAIAATATGGCVSSSAATYRHSFDGAAGTVTITATRPLCSGQTQTFSLVSYTTGAASGQFVYDSDRDTVTATNRSVTLKVAVPACSTQVEAFFGSSVQTESTSTKALYGTAKLGATTRSSGPLAWYAGGSATCTARPTVTVTNACDGTFTAVLANSRSATTAAVFVTGSRRIRLTPGATTTLTPAKGSTLTVRDSSHTTYLLSWRTPTTCTTTSPASSPTVAAVLPTAVIAAPTTTSPSPSPSVSTSASPYESAHPAYSTSPAAVATAEASDSTGLGTGSILAILLGLALIGTGVAAIAWLVRTNQRLA